PSVLEFERWGGSAEGLRPSATARSARVTFRNSLQAPAARDRSGLKPKKTRSGVRGGLATPAGEVRRGQSPLWPPSQHESLIGRRFKSSAPYRRHRGESGKRWPPVPH